ncbi:HepT-like ribonuclease domain-containing protein [Elioraea tepidiphila]|uniref:HepT-like ribonuclease domain-containing protein n=1 Tax=Elioraea tepidiphila TaxID=457934 RepID=UPI000361DC46|nr:hypothetical protein [Elioraea tepidiphila]
MAELPERDAAFLLDMLLAARDAQDFVAGMDQVGFMASRLHQNAVIRSLEVMARQPAGSPLRRRRDIRKSPGGRSRACATD